ncbi:metal tolerance protein C4 [Nicotiana tabacum]|uniref:Metal tolerance protein C4 n=1 Tax=Nicotiana tabacum TaxID=4097 RepID=A0A1S4AT53_TOBAC|nr:metal tolerance protein C4-like [Nicotiana tomentosiformis]XP_016479745.1 PREDICTED: metal tolerance protein C4-like [Nicotiana tabacum]
MPTPRVLSALRRFRHTYQGSHSGSLSAALSPLQKKFDFDNFHFCPSKLQEEETEHHFDAYHKFHCNPSSQISGGIPSPSSFALRSIFSVNSSRNVVLLSSISRRNSHLFFSRGLISRAKKIRTIEVDDHGQRAVTTALWCNFLVFSLKFGVWFVSSSHVMLAEVVHSVADFANQALLAYGLNSSRRAPDAIHPYGYSKERFVWSLISAVGIFCLGCGATIVHGVQNLWTSEQPANIGYAALVIGGSFIIEGISLIVAIQAVQKGAAAEGMTVRDYIWRGHDPTAVAVMTEDGAAVTGLAIAAASLVAVNATGNPIYDPIGSIIVGNLLGMVAIFLIQRNRHALIGRAIDDNDMDRVLQFLKNDPVVDSIYDCKSEVIGPGFFRFKAEIDFNGVVLVQNYLERAGREVWAKQFREASEQKDDAALLKLMSIYGEEVVTALGSEVDRLEKEIQEIVPGIRHVDIEAHNPIGPSP